jgi:prepilin-type N-terminal cleavage/methylation domain-containing protein
MRPSARGFTLIEMSIVLVVIGLIVGGILVGQSLISAAGVRATISQIEKYNAAVNTFYGKYGGLPGDLSATLAAQFGFGVRSGAPGKGDGNGLLEGVGGSCTPCGYTEQGESLMFWQDLSGAGLISETFASSSTNTSGGLLAPATLTSTPVTIGSLFPTAKLAQGNYVYVYSYSGSNYYGLSAITSDMGGGYLNSQPALTVQQAYAMDVKTDDGLPQSGNVTAKFLNAAGGASAPPVWTNASPGGTQAGSSATCYDNGGNVSNPMQYSMEENNGGGVNCALSFQMQGAGR